MTKENDSVKNSKKTTTKSSSNKNSTKKTTSTKKSVSSSKKVDTKKSNTKKVTTKKTTTKPIEKVKPVEVIKPVEKITKQEKIEKEVIKEINDIKEVKLEEAKHIHNKVNKKLVAIGVFISLLGVIALIITLIANRIIDREYISDVTISLMVVASVLIESFGAFIIINET